MAQPGRGSLQAWEQAGPRLPKTVWAIGRQRSRVYRPALGERDGKRKNNNGAIGPAALDPPPHMLPHTHTHTPVQLSSITVHGSRVQEEGFITIGGRGLRNLPGFQEGWLVPGITHRPGRRRVPAIFAMSRHLASGLTLPLLKSWQDVTAAGSHQQID